MNEKITNRSPRRHQSANKGLIFAPDTFVAGEDLFKCLQVALGTCSPKDLRLTPERWMAVSDLADKTFLGPLLFRSLPVGDSSLEIPKEVINRWFREYLANTHRNNLFYEHLRRVLDIFEKEDIPAILLKGIYLMDALYAERGMRTLSDIDILIRPEDKDKADKVMAQLGCTMVSWQDIPDPIHKAYLYEPSRMLVELHFALATDTPARPDLKSIWDRSRPIETMGKMVREMAIEDGLVNLGLHLTQHLLSAVMFPPGLRSLYDIALLFQKQSSSINCELLLETLRKLQGEQRFAIAIALAEEVFKIEVPAELNEGLKEVKLPQSEIETLRQHLLISSERSLVESRMPKFVRSSILANRNHILLGFLQRVFISRAELAERHGPCPHWHITAVKYMQHFRALIKGNFAPTKWIWGKETSALTGHFKKIATLHNRLKR